MDVDYRKQRNVAQHLQRVQCPTLIVGGWHDEQNLYGIVTSAKALLQRADKDSTEVYIGPWTHSDHRNREPTETRVGDISFGVNLVTHYQEKVEYPFFEHNLKPTSDPSSDQVVPPTRVFDTGTLKWHENLWPSGDTDTSVLYLGSNGQLSDQQPADSESSSFEYVSYPDKPVPYVEDDDFQLFPAKHFMTADQRFVTKRPDVLTFVTAPLENAVQVVGEIRAELLFATSESDADLIVKLIDVYPMDRKPQSSDTPGIKMNGYQRLVRCGQIRGRYREGYNKPLPFEPGVATNVNVELLDVCHTFGQGHRIMVQVQSSLFPLFDRNPQRYIQNIYAAKASDFKRAAHQIFAGSKVLLPVSGSPPAVRGKDVRSE